ncbi:MAG: hypothetical protein ACRCZS_05585, partial [Chroococcidiopsis sp.]
FYPFISPPSLECDRPIHMKSVSPTLPHPKQNLDSRAEVTRCTSCYFDFTITSVIKNIFVQTSAGY